MKTITRYRLEMIKENASRYEYNNPAKNVSEAVKLVNEVFHLENMPDEHMVMFCVDLKLKINAAFEISSGSLNSSIVHPREVFKRAILANSYGIILFHNHPSGACDPSKEDLIITKRLKEVGELVGIALIDHIIVGDNCYFSLKEADLLC